MQTELGFLIELLLNHDLDPNTKQALASRIKDVEQALSSKSQQPSLATTQTMPAKIIHGAQQAASTQAILERDDSQPQVINPIQTAPVAPIPANALAVNRIVGGMVDTGRGSKGPRKF